MGRRAARRDASGLNCAVSRGHEEARRSGAGRALAGAGHGWAVEAAQSRGPDDADRADPISELVGAADPRGAHPVAEAGGAAEADRADPVAELVGAADAHLGDAVAEGVDAGDLL